MGIFGPCCRRRRKQKGADGRVALNYRNFFPLMNIMACLSIKKNRLDLVYKGN